MTLSRYFHTLRHLKPGQVVGRIQQRLHRPRPDLRRPPALRSLAGAWLTPCRKEQSLVGPDRFRFLNEERQLVFPQAWNATGPSRLWVYNLHYFDDLTAVRAHDRLQWHKALIGQWILENPPARGTGWEPYPLSLRIVNWIKWSLAGNALDPEAVHSLAIQTRQLRRRLEFHLLGNHLFENAKALFFAGLFFTGEEAQEWLRTGEALLQRELAEQVLPDGGHFERSPMYHALVLEGLLDLANLCATFGWPVPAAWGAAVTGMLRWLRTMNHPDGGITFFNDAALGVAPDLEQLEAYAAALRLAVPSSGTGTCLLRDSGYARLEAGAAVVFADVAAVGPDYLPGHAHADSLSFELSVDGRRVLVNSGTSVYGTGPERQRQRGTAAHNTVRLDAVDSSDVWSGFRVGRRARVGVEHFAAQPTASLQASHDGYRHLKGRPEHRRHWMLDEHALTVEDTIEGNGHHLVEVFFHLHPDFSLRPDGGGLFSAVHKDSGGTVRFELDSQVTWQVHPGSWHPAFGVSVGNQFLHGRYEGPLPTRFTARVTWSR